MNRIKFTSPRGPNAVAAMHADEKRRIVSEDGLRWATNRWAKRKLPDNRWEPCETWTVRERQNGRAVVIRSGLSEEAARKYVEGAV